MKFFSHIPKQNSLLNFTYYDVLFWFSTVFNILKMLLQVEHSILFAHFFVLKMESFSIIIFIVKVILHLSFCFVIKNAHTNLATYKTLLWIMFISMRFILHLQGPPRLWFMFMSIPYWLLAIEIWDNWRWKCEL